MAPSRKCSTGSQTIAVAEQWGLGCPRTCDSADNAAVIQKIAWQRNINKIGEPPQAERADEEAYKRRSAHVDGGQEESRSVGAEQRKPFFQL